MKSKIHNFNDHIHLFMTKKSIFYLLFIVVLIISSNCSSSLSSKKNTAVQQNRALDLGIKFDSLVWSDEFNGLGIIDTTKWFHQTQIPKHGEWWGGIIQHYTNRIENSYQKDGNLNLVARKETFKSQGWVKEYTSARLNSKFAFTYGRIEIRAKMPFGVGTWPAIWMLNKNIDEDGAYWDNLGFGTTKWPHCGEIDILEHWGSDQDYVSSALHNTSSHGDIVKNVGKQKIDNASDKFHVYVFEWTKEKMVFSVDGITHYEYNPPIKNDQTWPYSSEYYLILNIAIKPDIDPSFIESPMVIDYIRIYQ